MRWLRLIQVQETFSMFSSKVCINLHSITMSAAYLALNFCCHKKNKVPLFPVWISTYLAPFILFFIFLNFILFIFLYRRFLFVIYFIHISVYICQSQSPNSSHHYHPPPTTFPHWCPYVCSLHLCLYFCLANWFICTIFVGSTCMR